MWGKIENKKIIKIYRVPEILRDANGTQYPKAIFQDSKRLEDFYIYSVVNKNSRPSNLDLYDGISESFAWNETDKKIERTYNATAKSINDTNAKDQDGKDLKDPITGKQVINDGLKTYLIKQVKAQETVLLAQTDKWIIRKADTGDDIPTTVASYRKSIRDASTKMETEINKIKDINDAVTLFTATKDTDALLYNFPSQPDDMPK